MFSYLKYLLPAGLSLLFLALTCWGFPLVFLLVLAFANVLNVAYGEFSAQEMPGLLRFYYSNPVARYLKIFNAFVLLAVFAGTFIYWDTGDYSVSRTLQLGLVLGLVSGCFMVTLAHDLLHGRTIIERAAAAGLLLAVGIPHFATDHLLGHHRYVGTARDKTTARLGQNFYHYFVHSLASRWWHSYFKPYPMSKTLRRRVIRINYGMLALNVVLVFGLLFFSAHPKQFLLLYLTQNVLANVLYELINYIQHYGLARQTGVEPLKVEHAWNCYFKYTNYILFLLPLHSQHHLPARISTKNELLMGPRMPYLYFAMILLALVPGWWFHKMDPLVAQIKQS